MNLKTMLKQGRSPTGFLGVRGPGAEGAKSLMLEIRASAAAILILGLVLCGLYPLVVWVVGQAAFPHLANGSLIQRDGKVIGSRLLAQNFTAECYFHPRPSAAGTNGYDAAASGGSNLGPLSKKLSDEVKRRAEVYRTVNILPPGTRVPADAVTSSGSGLDPHISVENAGLQAARVARSREMSTEKVRELIREFTEGRQFGFLGDRGVNVLKLNLAIDALQSSPFKAGKTCRRGVQ